jgi:hypothetical protein
MAFAVVCCLAFTGLDGIARATTPAWSVVNSGNAVSRQGSLAAVSCATTSACTAVGAVPSGAGPTPLVERWKPSTSRWVVQHINVPPGSQPQLTGVSCATATDCVAVGSFVATSGRTRVLGEHWDGTTWHVVPVPRVVGWDTTLSGVSCVSASYCLAVGAMSHVPWPHITNSLTVEWDGTNWHRVVTTTTIATSVPFNPLDPIGSVSCSAAHLCTEVFHTDGTAPVIERWDGANMTSETSATPSGSTSVDLSSVACPTDSDCESVGSYVDSAGRHNLAESWDGSAWSVQNSPQPTTGVALNAVSCAAVDVCVAAGNAWRSHGDPQLQRWNGSTWSTRPLPPLPGAAVVLAGASCPADGGCRVVGSNVVPAGEQRTLALVPAGADWVKQTTANPSAPLSDWLSAVSCAPTDATACVSVGRTDIAGQPRPLAEIWQTDSWVVTAVPLPAGASAADLDAVSCAAATSCTAVGRAYFPPNLTLTAPLAEHWDGAHWSVEPMHNPDPKPAPYGVALAAVSCPPGSDTCTAVGGFTPAGTSTAAPYIVHYDGTSWSRQQYWQTWSTKFIRSLTAVSCPTPTSCMAVGISFGRNGNKSIASRWNGTAWLAAKPVPTQFEAQLNGVSCPAADVCEAVGFQDTDSSATSAQPLAERWDGTSWAIQPFDAAPNQRILNLYGVSCSSATTCVGVGLGEHQISGQPAGEVPVAEQLVSGSWQSTASVDLPQGGGFFNGVTCPTSSECDAVGVQQVSGPNATLAENYR